MKNILIKSIDRSSGTSSNFIIKSKDILDGNYVLKNLIIPNSLYNVTDQNNTFTLFENSTSKQVIIPIGNYTSTQFSTELNTQLDASSSGFNTFTTTISNTTAKLTITAGNTFQLIFPNDGSRRLLGYNELETDITTSITSDNIIDLAKPTSIGIEIKESNIENFENISTRASACIYIPFNVTSGFYQSLNIDDFEQTIHFNKIRNLSISVVNTSDNTQLDLNGGEFEILLSKC